MAGARGIVCDVIESKRRYFLDSLVCVNQQQGWPVEIQTEAAHLSTLVPADECRNPVGLSVGISTGTAEGFQTLSSSSTDEDP